MKDHEPRPKQPYFDDQSLAALDRMIDIAEKSKSKDLSTSHLVGALIENERIVRSLNGLNVNPDDIRGSLLANSPLVIDQVNPYSLSRQTIRLDVVNQFILQFNRGRGSLPRISPSLASVITRSINQAKSQKRLSIEVQDQMVAVVKFGKRFGYDAIKDGLRVAGVTDNELIQELENYEAREDKDEAVRQALRAFGLDS